MKHEYSDSYEDFYRVFLSEMPYRVPGNNGFLNQLSVLQELIANGEDVTPINHQTFKIEVGNQVLYWVGTFDGTTVLMTVEAAIVGNFCKIQLTSKNPNISKGSPPFASDLYALIMKDQNRRDISLSSDDMMSDDAIELWKGLVNRGSKISVFDRNSYQYVLTDVNSVDELLRYVGNDAESGRFVFVLSEDRTCRSGVKLSVAVMEIKRQSGYPLQEMFDYYKKGK